jgi:hypothetical protein
MSMPHEGTSAAGSLAEASLERMLRSLDAMENEDYPSLYQMAMRRH